MRLIKALSTLWCIRLMRWRLQFLLWRLTRKQGLNGGGQR